MIQVRTECLGETLDCGSSRAFAVCDHAVAHVHVNDESALEEVGFFSRNTGRLWPL